MDFDEADAKIHSVQSEWHYEIMTRYGFVAKNDTAVGFVRSYEYENSSSGIKIRFNTGYSSCYWVDETNNKQGYWSDLEQYLKSLK